MRSEAASFSFLPCDFLLSCLCFCYSSSTWWFDVRESIIHHFCFNVYWWNFLMRMSEMMISKLGSWIIPSLYVYDPLIYHFCFWCVLMKSFDAYIWNEEMMISELGLTQLMLSFYFIFGCRRSFWSYTLLTGNTNIFLCFFFWTQSTINSCSCHPVVHKNLMGETTNSQSIYRQHPVLDVSHWIFDHYVDNSQSNNIQRTSCSGYISHGIFDHNVRPKLTTHFIPRKR